MHNTWVRFETQLSKKLKSYKYFASSNPALGCRHGGGNLKTKKGLFYSFHKKTAFFTKKCFAGCLQRLVNKSEKFVQNSACLNKSSECLDEKSCKLSQIARKQGETQFRSQSLVVSFRSSKLQSNWAKFVVWLLCSMHNTYFPDQIGKNIHRDYLKTQCTLIFIMNSQVVVKVQKTSFLLPHLKSTLEDNILLQTNHWKCARSPPSFSFYFLQSKLQFAIFSISSKFLWIFMK